MCEVKVITPFVSEVDVSILLLPVPDRLFILALVLGERERCELFLACVSVLLLPVLLEYFVALHSLVDDILSERLALGQPVVDIRIDLGWQRNLLLLFLPPHGLSKHSALLIVNRILRYITADITVLLRRITDGVLTLGSETDPCN